MVVNFKAYEISRGARKLIQTPTLIKKKNNLFWLKILQFAKFIGIH